VVDALATIKSKELIEKSLDYFSHQLKVFPHRVHLLERRSDKGK
jgi:hypothetical protein